MQISCQAVRDDTSRESRNTRLEYEQSKVVEFQLSLDGQATQWYSQQDISSFLIFDDLAAKFEDLFQVKLDPTEVLWEYYSLKQQPTK